MQFLQTPYVVAIVQAAPIYLDREATLDKACELILEAGRHGARLIAFPESFVPCYPDWVWTIPAGHDKELNELYAEFLANAVTIPSDALAKVCRSARRAKTCVVLGVTERNAEASGASLYNSLLFIDAQGKILGKHRKLILTSGERLVWTQGDGSTLGVYNTPLGKLGGLIGGENYMPLALYALYAVGVQIFVATAREGGELWYATLRHLAKQGGMFVLSPCSVSPAANTPDNFSRKEKIQRVPDEWCDAVHRHIGGSAVVNPSGDFIAGPVHAEQEILYAGIDTAQLRGAKRLLDVAGHDARPDVFQLWVNRQARTPLIHKSDTCILQAGDDASDSFCGI